MNKLLVLLLLICLDNNAIAQNMTLINQNIIELDATDTAADFSIKVKMTGTAKFADVKLTSDKPDDVQLGAKSYKDALTIEKNKSGAPALNVHANMQLLNQQGTYAVTLQYEVTAGSPEYLTFSLSRPAATIDTVSTVHVQVVGGTVRDGGFMLNAHGSKASIHHLKLSSPRFADINEPALLHFKEPEYTILAGSDTFQAVYEFNQAALNKLTLGRYSGKLYVTAPELVATLIVPFDIWIRSNPFYLFLYIFIGLALGFLARHYLKEKKEWEATRIRAFQLQAKIVSETDKITDAAFKKDIDDLLSKLNPFLNVTIGLIPSASDAQKNLSAKIDKTQTDYDTRTGIFNTYFSAQRDNLKILGAAINPSLQDLLKQRLAPIQFIYNTAKSFIDKFDPTSAESQLNQAIDQIERILRPAYSYYATFAALLKDDHFYPSAFAAAEVQSMQKYAGSIEGIVALKKPVPVSVSDAASDVNNMDAIVSHAGNAIKYAFEVIDTSFIPDAAKLQPGGDDALKFKINAWKAILVQMRDNPDNMQTPAHYLPAHFIDELNGLWTQLAPNPSNKTAAQQALIDKRTGRDIEKVPSRFGFEPSGFTTDSAVIQTAMANSQKAGWLWIWAALLQMLILLLLIGAGIYITYADSFTGTLKEAITIIIFSFSMDITVDSVATLKK